MAFTVLSMSAVGAHINKLIFCRYGNVIYLFYGMYP